MAVQFDSAWRSAYVDQLRSLLPGRCRDDLDLLPFHETVAALGHEGEIALGRQEVPVDAVVGSVARVGDFDRQFRPRQQHLRDRWQGVAEADRDMAPIRLIRLNDFYFVEDGHHRISVARARGIPTVTADVRRIRTTVCANRTLTIKDLPAKAAERMFLERVPLSDDVRVGLVLDDPGDWRRLADAAEAWAFRQSLDGRAVADRQQLAERWWAEEVEPLVQSLRGRGICATGADLGVYSQLVGSQGADRTV
jgi:hypothetical protein